MLATNLRDIASNARLQKNFDKSAKCFENALLIYNKLVQSKEYYRKYIAAVNMNCSNLWFDKGDNLKAIQLCSEAVNIYVDLIKKNNTAFEGNYLKAVYSLGNFYFWAEQFDSAVQVLKKVVIDQEKRVKAYPQQYEIDLERALNTLAVTYWKQKNYETAEKTFKKAVDLHKILLNPRTPQYKLEICKTNFNLGAMYQQQKKLELAENQYIKAADARREAAEKQPNVYGTNHQVTLQCLVNLYDSMRLNEQDERKIKVWNDYQTKYRNEMVALQIKIIDAYEKAAVNGKHPKLNEAYGQLATYYLSIDKIKEAEVAAKKQDTNKADFLVFLYAIQGKYKEAEGVLMGINDKKASKIQCSEWADVYYFQKIISENTRTKINKWLENVQIGRASCRERV